ERIQKHSGGRVTRLLELACGTGGHAFELEKLGYQIVATDYSEDLLTVGRQKAARANSKIEFRFQDMRTLSLPEDAFDAAYCLFDSIGYVQTNSAIRQVLNGIHAHLKPDGLFVFEFWHAAAMLRNFEPHRERRWKTDDGELVRGSSTRLDVAKQLAEVSYDIEHIGRNGSSHHLQETQINRYFLVQEMSAFLEDNGFIPLEFLPAYEKDSAIDENTWHILAVARRK
ncbi:MAG: class I SAM-dependent methyltransferase, partial [Sedimentisphaerales bacterium]|nr:class I SAM-dependent methyltransferase [Sedimentisphaerales bacterium]